MWLGPCGEYVFLGNKEIVVDRHDGWGRTTVPKLNGILLQIKSRFIQKASVLNILSENLLTSCGGFEVVDCITRKEKRIPEKIRKDWGGTFGSIEVNRWWIFHFMPFLQCRSNNNNNLFCKGKLCSCFLTHPPIHTLVQSGLQPLGGPHPGSNAGVRCLLKASSFPSCTFKHYFTAASTLPFELISIAGQAWPSLANDSM